MFLNTMTRPRLRIVSENVYSMRDALVLDYGQQIVPVHAKSLSNANTCF